MIIVTRSEGPAGTSCESENGGVEVDVVLVG